MALNMDYHCQFGDNQVPVWDAELASITSCLEEDSTRNAQHGHVESSDTAIFNQGPMLCDQSPWEFPELDVTENLVHSSQHTVGLEVLSGLSRQICGGSCGIPRCPLQKLQLGNCEQDSTCCNHYSSYSNDVQPAHLSLQPTLHKQHYEEHAQVHVPPCTCTEELLDPTLALFNDALKAERLILDNFFMQSLAQSRARTMRSTTSGDTTTKSSKKMLKQKKRQISRRYYTKQIKSNDDFYFYCISPDHEISTSTTIDKSGGELTLSTIQTSLSFPEGAVEREEELQASLTLSLQENYPPIRTEQLVISCVMRCGPAGGVFKKYAQLEVPHCADIAVDKLEEALKKLQLWCRRSSNESADYRDDWELVFDEGQCLDKGIQVTLLAEKLLIHTTHFTEFESQYAGAAERTVLMFIKSATLLKLDVVYLKVLVLMKEKVKLAVEAEKTDGWNNCCVSSGGVVFKVLNNEKPLKVRVFNIQPPKHWQTTESTDEIPYEYLQKGSAKLEMSFNKKRKSTLRIRGLFNVEQEGNTFSLPDSHFDSEMVSLPEDSPPTPYTNPPSAGSLGYASASPGLSENPGSVRQPPSVEMAPASLEMAPPASVESTPPSVRNHERDKADCRAKESQDNGLDDRDIRRLAKQIGREWEALAHFLGFKKAEVERLRMDGTNRGIENVICDMLGTWKQRQPNNDRGLWSLLSDALEKADRRDLAQSLYTVDHLENVAGQSSQGSFSPPPAKRLKTTPHHHHDPRGGGDCVQQASSSQNQQEQYVRADASGYYTDHKVKCACPSEDQLNSETHYNMWGKCQKGKALVINISDFKDFNLALSPAAEIDGINTVHLLKQLGYDVTERHDLTAREINRSILNFTASCNQDVNCASAVLVLMSYGTSTHMYDQDMKPFEMARIHKHLDEKNCPGLKNKPKIIFYQAYQIPSTSKYFETSDDEEGSCGAAIWTANMPNVCMVYAMIDAQEPLHKNQGGCWFIQGLCEVFLSCAHEDSLGVLLFKLKKHISNIRQQSQSYQYLATQQTVEIYNRFLKEFYFMPGFSGNSLTQSSWEFAF